MSQFKNYKKPLLYILLIFAFDRISKIWALAKLKEVANIDVLPFFKLTFVQNTGAAFGSFQNGNTGLIFVSILVLIALIKYRKDIFELGKLASYGWVFIIGGALGNLYDRIFIGYVIDYFNFIVWPVFNVADSFITIGAIMLAGCILKDEYKKFKQKREVKK
ncbi:MAG: signal peptidase II [Elusimicrobiaceae bacterium]|nr:signal peptidase II [Elusimicrobiaceae bacterium]